MQREGHHVQKSSQIHLEDKVPSFLYRQNYLGSFIKVTLKAFWSYIKKLTIESGESGFTLTKG